MGVKRLSILFQCLPVATAIAIPLSCNLEITSYISGLISAVPSATKVPSISEAISLII